jgi:hypothetical protein
MRNSLKYELNKRTFESDIGHKDSLSDLTIKNYKDYNAKFRDFCMKQGCNTFDKVQKAGAELLRDYVKDMVARGLSDATIHSYLSAPCKALGLHMQDIEKPKRITAKGKRAAGTETERSSREKISPEYKAAYDFCRATGVREHEAQRMTGGCAVRDNNNMLCVRVVSGKGGKEQLQRILPQNEAVVLAAFAGKGEEEKLFTKKQFSKNINYHLARAKNAQDAYYYYHSTYQTEADRQKLSKALVEEYRAALEKSKAEGKIKSFKDLEKRTAIFADNVIDNRDKVYRLRGNNLKLAIEKGLPVEYDRLALMAVSVFHLSHWRLDVTICNYMLR